LEHIPVVHNTIVVHIRRIGIILQIRSAPGFPEPLEIELRDFTVVVQVRRKFTRQSGRNSDLDPLSRRLGSRCTDTGRVKDQPRTAFDILRIYGITPRGNHVPGSALNDIQWKVEVSGRNFRFAADSGQPRDMHSSV